MGTGDGRAADDAVPQGIGSGIGSVAEALRLADASLDFLNSPAAAEFPAAALGEVLVSIGTLQAKLTAARAALLRRFDAADAHDSDGYGCSAAWLAALAGMTRRDANAAVRQMRQLGQHPDIAAAVAAGQITDSWAAEIIGWLKRLPEELRAGTEKILVEAAAAGASLDDLATIIAHALKQWQEQHPDPDDDDNGFGERYVSLDTTFGGAGVIRGDLTPECAAAVQAVLEALGKRGGPEDDRTQNQRFHDALQLACELLIRARMVPDRAGADTQVLAHIPLSDLRRMAGASALEQGWINALVGQGDGDGYLTGKDAEAAACDAMIVPVVTGQANPAILDKMIELAFTAACHVSPPAFTACHVSPMSFAELSPEAWRALRYEMARLAIDLVSGPAGIAAALRRGLLEHPYSTPSLPLDIGWSESIPSHIRRAVMLRDRHCAWPGCRRPIAWCDVHHIVHKGDGGETSVDNCALLCQFHHDVCIHRRGWRIVLHPDGTTSAYGPEGAGSGGQILHSHAPPGDGAPGHDPPGTAPPQERSP